MTWDELNAGDDVLMSERLKQCCGSTAWVKRVMELHPFADREALLSAADTVWESLTPADWLEAFAQHPRIGATRAAKWSAEEQRGMGAATAQAATTMAQLNIDYERKFGWIFIICATGKSAEEMIASITMRLNNDPDTELKIAAAEQSKITKLRIAKLLAE